MADYERLFAALASGGNADKLIAADDPYLPGVGIADRGNSLIQSLPNVSTRDRLLGAAITGLVGGGFQGLSQDFQARAKDKYADSLIAAITGSPMEQPDVLAPNIFADAQNVGTLFRAQRAMEGQAAQQKLEQEIALAKVKAGLDAEGDQKTEIAKAIAQNPRRAGDIIAAVKALETGEAPIAVSDKEKKEEKTGMFGGKNMQSKLEDSAQRFMDSGVSPSAAADLAAKALTADNIMNKNSAEKVAESRRIASGLSALIEKAETGITGAGDTGGPLGGLKWAGAKVASLVSPDQAQKLAATSVLDSVKPEIVQMLRSPGAVTNLETDMLVKAGPSSSNTPLENRALLDQMRIVRDQQSNYADFLETYAAEKGDLVGADKLWSEYMKANPLTLRDQSGNVLPNPGRKSWIEHFQGGTAPTTPTTPPQAGAAVQITPEQARAMLKARGVPGY